MAQDGTVAAYAGVVCGAGKTLALASYASTLSAAFAAGAGAEPLRGLAADDFEDLYDEILSAETRGPLEHRNLRTGCARCTTLRSPIRTVTFPCSPAMAR